MERYNADRSYATALRSQVVFVAPETESVEAADDTAPSGLSYSYNGHQTEVFPNRPRLSETSDLEDQVRATIHNAFDPHLTQLARLQASLRLSPLPTVNLDDDRPIQPKSSRHQWRSTALPTYLLPGTLAYLQRLAHPPLLPDPRVITFEAAFRRHEPMFHTVFYRKYPPYVLDDAKQEGLLALFRKWLKNKSILDQTSAYVTTAAIYGVSNWRQKGMKVRGNEGALTVDAHGKVIGEPHAHTHERWTDRIDRRLDVAQAVEGVLYQYAEHPDYREICRVVLDVRDDIPFKHGQQASGLSFRAYKQHRNDVKARLRRQLAEYAPRTESAVSKL